ncbi:DUF711 family protein [Streptomyces sp. TRM S81-3]|uniref:DUF711 family protein n=1 Tax=Streptomyces griseicoloratus TaxID=2752516 RepID=A0A926QTH5_9ACTN|nr:DUF711 family protein [Streptomyces griseicoloratus]MBD0422890.1 DUF711 family protein [Streptomyces griseicoloratus]
MTGTTSASPVRAVTLCLPDELFHGERTDTADTAGIGRYGEKAMVIGDEIAGAGYEVQTVRLSSPALDRPIGHDRLRARAAGLVEGCRRSGVGSASLGALRPSALTGLEPSVVADVLVAHPSLFLAVVVADGAEVDHAAVAFSGAVVRELASRDAEANFRFAAVAHLGANAPLFPGSYSDGGDAGVSVGLQSAGPLLARAREAAPAGLTGATELTRTCLHEQLDPLDDLLRPACERHGLLFHGFDPSPACAPDAGIGEFLETVGGIRFGTPGTMAACAAVTAGIRSVGRPTVGYAGLMLPVLEDRVLALAWQEGRIDTDSVLAYSSVCGAGMDTIPLPASTPEHEVTAMIADMAALSARWRKPLSARLMPAPPDSDPHRTQFRAEQIVNIAYPTR